VLETRADVQEAGILAPLVGHVGDGNFHLIFPMNPDDPGELDKAKAVNARLITRALAMGGTVSGEHGVGVGKMAYLEAEHGEGLEVMRAIKRALDPENRMNPGKMISI
jgi:D-lactate dehydrogenase (cytochrome)